MYELFLGCLLLKWLIFSFFRKLSNFSSNSCINSQSSTRFPGYPNILAILAFIWINFCHSRKPRPGSAIRRFHPGNLPYKDTTT